MLEIIVTMEGGIPNRSAYPCRMMVSILLSLSAHCLVFGCVKENGNPVSVSKKVAKVELHARLTDRDSHSAFRPSITKNLRLPSFRSVNDTVDAAHDSEPATPRIPVALGDGDLDAPLRLLDDYAVANLNLPADLVGDADISLLIDAEGAVKWVELDQSNLPDDIVQNLRIELPNLRFSKPISRGVSTTVFIKLKLNIGKLATSPRN